MLKKLTKFKMSTPWIFFLPKNITNSCGSLTHFLFAAAINVQPNPVRFAQLTSKYWEDFGHLRPGWKNLNYNLPTGRTLSNSSDVCQSVGRLVHFFYNVFVKYPSSVAIFLVITLAEPSNPGEKPCSRIGQC